MTPVKVKRKRLKPGDRYYINNKKFSHACAVWVGEVNEIKARHSNLPPEEIKMRDLVEKGVEFPEIPRYVAQCFIDLSTKMSTKYNFSSYSFREEMVADGIENCIRACERFKPHALTASGDMNAFSYFTTCIWNAFLRRIKKEGKEVDKKNKMLMEADLSSMVTIADRDNPSVVNYIDGLKSIMDEINYSKDDNVMDKIIEKESEEHG